MSLLRKDNWPELLAEFISNRMDKPFIWGENDCGLFACDAVLLMTGLDLAEKARGKYANSDAAAAITSKYDVIITSNLEEYAEAVAESYLLPSVPILMARRGDIALYLSILGPTLGIVAMNGKEVLIPGPEGLRGVPLASCKKAWRIG